MKRNRPRGSFWLGVPVALPCASDALGSGSILPRVYICHIPIVRRDKLCGGDSVPVNNW